MASVETDQPRVIVDMISAATEKVVKFVTLEVHANLQSHPTEGGTPIDTGFASASWIPAVGEANLAVAGSRDAVDKGLSDAGAAAVLTYRLNQGAVFVSNNVPYILKVNDGWSQQAPAGFVDSAVERAVDETQRQFSEGL